MSGFTLPPRDNTQQYKRCVHLWNSFPCIINLACSYVVICAQLSLTGSCILCLKINSIIITIINIRIIKILIKIAFKS